MAEDAVSRSSESAAPAGGGSPGFASEGASPSEVGATSEAGAPSQAGAASELHERLLADFQALLQQHHERLGQHTLRMQALLQSHQQQLSQFIDHQLMHQNHRAAPAASAGAPRAGSPEKEVHTVRFPRFSTSAPRTEGRPRRSGFGRSFTESMVIKRQTARQSGAAFDLPTVEEPQSKIARLVHSSWFEGLVCFFIVANSILFGVETQYMAQKQLAEPTSSFAAVTLMFTCFFTAELFLRVAAEMRMFFLSSEWLWNTLDTVIVAVSIVELVLNTAGLDDQLIHVRIIRATRTVRIFRMVRIFKVFSSLRVLVYCVLSTMRSLIWTLFLLTVVLYLFGILFTQAATEHTIVQGCTNKDLCTYFGSLWRTAYTLFKAITGGLSWEEAASPLGHVHLIWEVLFICYISFTYFAVLNVVTGVFCQSAIESAAHDKDMVVQAQLANKRLYTEQLQDLFSSIDANNRGHITFHMLEECLNDPNLQAYFDALGITSEDAWNLFTLLDENESNSLDIDEFVTGCLKLRGSARSIDSHMLMYESRWTMKKVTNLAQAFQELLNMLQLQGSLASRWAASTHVAPPPLASGLASVSMMGGSRRRSLASGQPDTDKILHQELVGDGFAIAAPDGIKHRRRSLAVSPRPTNGSNEALQDLAELEKEAKQALGEEVPQDEI